MRLCYTALILSTSGAMTPEPVPVLTIDGPSGAGKGTVSRAVAARLGWHLLDSGAIYRAVAHAVQRDGVDLTDVDALAAAAGEVQIAFVDEHPEDDIRVVVDGEDATDQIRTETCGSLASRIAAVPAVREILLAKQRSFRRAPGLVADGRDMGTVVFADAPFKVFLVASPEERATRRYKQLKGKDAGVTLAPLLSDIRERDARDAARAVAPLKPAADALLIDTTEMPVATVVSRVLAVARGD